MTSIQVHKEQIKEHLQEIDDALALGIEKRASTIGLHTSACSISLLEIYLHSLGKISSGATLKHDWFKRPKPGQKISPLAERKLGVDFQSKEEILSLMYLIEENRNKLVYGKPDLIITKIVLNSFQKLHDIIKEELNKVGEEIE